MAEHDLFEAEESALRAATDTHALDSLDARSYRDALGTLIVQFRRLVRDARRVIVHSDRQERELNTLNARLTQLAAELDYKAKHDPLTGAFNRRAVIELTEAHLHDDALALIVLDIDHFKRVNDEHGHPAVRSAMLTDVQTKRCTKQNAAAGMLSSFEAGLSKPILSQDAALRCGNFQPGRTK
jgi:predicted signal transduction protein with EAL and GGDEF domain